MPLLSSHSCYFISSKGFLPIVVDTMVIWVKFTHSSPFEFSDSENVDVHSCHLLFDHFQGPMQYCSLKHQTLLLSPVTSTTGCCFQFGSISSFFLEFFHWSPVAYWAPADVQSSSFSVISFCLFMLFMGFSRQEYWSGLPLLPFPSPVSSVQSLSHVRLSATPWSADARPPCPSPTLGVHPNPCPSSRWCHQYEKAKR